MNIFSGIIERKKQQAAAEDKVYKEIGETIARFGDYQAHTYLKDRFIEEGEIFDTLRGKLKTLADQSMFKFLHDDKQGREIALKAHYNVTPVSNADLVATVFEIRGLLAAYAPEKFKTPEQQAKFIDGFDRRVQGVIEQITHEAVRAKPVPASSLGM